MTATKQTRAPNSRLLAGLLTFLGAALLAFNDIAPLRSIGGGLFASPGWLPLCLAVFIVYKDAKTPSSAKLTRFCLLILAGGALFSVGSLPFLGAEVSGENPSVKATKLLLTLIIWCVVFVGSGLLYNALRNWLLAGLIAAVAIMIISSIIGQLGFGIFEQTGFFHGTPNGQMRLRGTRLEASSLGAGLLCCVSLFALFIRGRKAVFFMAMAYVAVQFLTRSRGTWVTISILLLVCLLLLLLGDRVSVKSSIFFRLLPWAVVVLTIALSFGLSFLVTSAFWIDLGLADGSGMTSETTRSVWAGTTLASLLSFPFGMGFAGYLAWLPQLLLQTTSDYLGSFYTADFGELSVIVNSSDDSVLSPKTLPGLLIVFFGWIGAAVAVFLCHRAVLGSLRFSREGYSSAPVAALAVLLVGFTYSSSVFSWDQALVLGIFSLQAVEESSKFSPRVNSLRVRSSVK